MKPLSWAEKVPVINEPKLTLMSFAKNANSLGEGKKSIASIVADTGFTNEQVIQHCNFLKLKQIINVLDCKQAIFIHYQLSMHIPPENFGVTAS